MVAKIAIFKAPSADELLHPRWRHDAACRDSDPEAMYPPDGRDSKARWAVVARAKATCGGCPVRRPCLATALWRREEHGIWGGLTYEERIRLGPSGRLTASEALAAADRMLLPIGGRR